MLLLPLILIAGCSITQQPGSERGLERGGWDGRYFSFDGEFDYYVGFDLQQLHADTGIDYREKLDFLASYDVNKVRIWLFPSFFGLPGERRYPVASEILYPWRVDSKSNKFDIDNWNPEFWTRTRDFLAYAKEKGFIVEVSLFSVQEARDYFKDPQTSYPFHHANNIQNFGRPTDPDGRFMRGFFDLEYTDNGLRLADYHKAYIDKALQEFSSFDHIYYELINESPAGPKWVRKELPHDWMKFWLSYIADKTTRLVTVHSSGFMNLRNENSKGWTSVDYEAVGQRYWNEDYVDGFNFHLYSTNPSLISQMLSGYQQRGRMLICNEGDSYYDIDRSAGYPDFKLTLDESRLYGEIRHAWGMMMAAGYYSIYYGPVPSLGDETSVAGARAMQALRRIVEMTEFQNMRPVTSDGTEFDSLVSAGPARHWQVIAEPGVNYLIYFWGSKSSGEVAIELPPGDYHYSWMDTRKVGSPLGRGAVRPLPGGIAHVPPPQGSGWHKNAGIVLLIEKK